MLDPLIGVRILHFASTVIGAGAAIFLAAVANPVLRRDGAFSAAALTERELTWLLLAALVVAVASGAFWLFLLASQLAQAPVSEAITNGTAWSVLSDTQFGRVSGIRFGLALMLAVMAALKHRSRTPRFYSILALVGTAFVAGLAWCGHAGGGIGIIGKLQVWNDVFHLATVAVWVGGLLPLLLFIRPGLQLTWNQRFHVVRQFSFVATFAVALLVASGVVNTWFMTNGFQGLFSTTYGKLVLLKVALVSTMLGFAAINRFWLTPKLALQDEARDSQRKALRILCLFTTVEFALGLAAIFVVGVLGQLEPVGHVHH